MKKLASWLMEKYYRKEIDELIKEAESVPNTLTWCEIRRTLRHLGIKEYS